jgi:hypothetical protein
MRRAGLFAPLTAARAAGYGEADSAVASAVLRSAGCLFRPSLGRSLGLLHRNPHAGQPRAGARWARRLVAPGRDGRRHGVGHAYDVLEALEVPVVETAPSIGLRAGDVAWANAWLEDQGLAGSRLLGVHPGAGGPQKRRRADRFARVAEHLVDRFRCKVVVTGSPVDGEAVRAFLHEVRINAAQAPMSLSVGCLCVLIQRSAVLLCSDCGPMHIAAALRVPVVAVFGPSSPQLWGPFPADSRHVVLAASDGRIQSVTVQQVVSSIDESPLSSWVLQPLQPARASATEAAVNSSPSSPGGSDV